MDETQTQLTNKSENEEVTLQSVANGAVKVLDEWVFGVEEQRCVFTFWRGLGSRPLLLVSLCLGFIYLGIFFKLIRDSKGWIEAGLDFAEFSWWSPPHPTPPPFPLQNGPITNCTVS